MDLTLSLGVVVLAAGAGSRYSDDPGAKLLASFDGQPLLARVLDEVRDFAPAVTVVVLGHGATHIEGAIDWAGELRVRNDDPQRGLSSSLQVGFDAIRAIDRVRQPLDGAFIVLGDQPLLCASVMRDLARAATNARPADRSAVVPRYATGDTARNPVLLLRPAWPWIDELRDDHGLGSLVAARPDTTLEVDVDGAMPDVDTPADLERLASRSADPGTRSSRGSS